MKRKIKLNLSLILATFFMVSAFNLNAQTDKQKELINDAKESKAAFITKKPEMAALFEKAAGYVIFPNVGEGAYILGGAAGNGVLFEGGQVEGFSELRQLDIGLQIGGQAYRQVILFETESELNKFKEGKYKLSGKASAVIIEEGKAKSVSFDDGRAIVTMPKAGAMIDIAVGGQKFEYRDLND
ncbi:lipid-binding SYLF domain-containing protein [Zunongwangia endophytica]|uniref:Lipid-binding SYLF domain-containing protein n=1 Tax=Zunongwangia endophytica TaxID=1808945 RepID=A0ABV8H688_9FLAO|nr:lipid-binding SYLF domain-containing protein [Zunongwangia endophytica]MDN3596134.1 lipid-binding SYLF domain-containing protein [Zunongwangia endophytica]